MSGTSYQPGPAPRTRKITSSYGLMLLVLGCLGIGLWAATQYVAYGFGFHPNLGPAWLALPSRSDLYLQAGAVLLTGVVLTLLTLSRAKRRGECLRRRVFPGLLLAGTLYGLSLCPVLYSPSRYVSWAIAYGGLEETSSYFALFNEGLLFGGSAFAGALMVIMLARSDFRKLETTGSHGTSFWSDGQALMKEHGLMIGRHEIPGKQHRSKLLRYDGEGHLITVAPTRSGKGVGGVMPNLLSYPGSVVVTDPKGENYAVTSTFRKGKLKQDVFALDPFDQLGAFGLTPSSDSFNPMDMIDDDSPDLLESADLLADMLVVPPTGRGGEENFWFEEAKALLSGLILFVAVETREARAERTRRAKERLQDLLNEDAPKGQAEVRRHAQDVQEAKSELKARKKGEGDYQGRTLMEVRRLLTLPKDEFALLTKDMLQCKGADGMVARAAARHMQKADKERSSVVSTAQSHTHFLDSPRMARVLRSSETLRLSGLKNQRMSLYLILPAHYLDTYNRWLRLMIACALHELARTPGAAQDRVLFLLDEFANLGRMNPVQRAVSLLAGYGASIWMFLQDLSQLKGTYPEKWGTFLANADVLQAFGTNDYDTARYLSDLTGDTTIYVASENQSLSRSRGKYTSRGQTSAQTFTEKARKLLLPDEVRRMDATKQLLFVKGMAPIRCSKINYLNDPEFFEQEQGLKAWRRLLIKWGLLNARGDCYRPVFDENPMFKGISAQVASGGDGAPSSVDEAAALAQVEEEMALLAGEEDEEQDDDDFSLGLSDPLLPAFMRDDWEDRRGGNRSNNRP